jgi:hypothetical protein
MAVTDNAQKHKRQHTKCEKLGSASTDEGIRIDESEKNQNAEASMRARRYPKETHTTIALQSPLRKERTQLVQRNYFAEIPGDQNGRIPEEMVMDLTVPFFHRRVRSSPTETLFSCRSGSGDKKSLSETEANPRGSVAAEGLEG